MTIRTDDAEGFRALCRTREQAHEAARKAYAYAQTLIENGERPLITCSAALEPIEVQQRKFLHGVVLKQISEQVRIDGQRYTLDVWKEFYRKLFLPDRFVMKKAPRWDAKLGRIVTPKRATPHREPQSTETLGVRGYSKFIDQVIAHAVSEFGVEFQFTTEERDEVRWRAAAGRRRAQQREEEPA